MTPENNSSNISLLAFTDVDSKELLYKYAKADNIVDELDEFGLAMIANKVLVGFNEDETSQREWKSRAADIQRLAKLESQPKNTPLLNSANIKYPLIADACYQYVARTYSEIVQDGKVAKFEVIGQDPTGILDIIATAGSDFMNYKLLGPDNEWEAALDRLLFDQALIGYNVKKTYYCPLKKEIISEVCNFRDIVLRNDSSIHCLKDLRRITHILHYHPNDIIEGCRLGIYCEKTAIPILNYYSAQQTNPECTIYEQHRYLDLDKDGYEEPYIVSYHKQTNQILRIVARFEKDDIEFKKGKVTKIKPIEYFTDFHYLPNPDGSYMSVGIGTLMFDLNDTVNTILNQLTDAGSLSNMQTGIIDSRIKLMGGQIGVEPGQWTRAKGVTGVNIKDGIFPLNYKEPSTVLFQLLGMIIEASKELSSSTDIMQGAMTATNVPATSMLAMIEQGMKRLSGIQKRMYRSIKEELRKISVLMQKYADSEEFGQIVSTPDLTPEMVFSARNLRVFPIADPNLASDTQRIAQAQVIMGLLGKPGINNAEVYKRYLSAAKVSHPELIAPPDQQHQANAPDPKLIEAHAEMVNKQSLTTIKGRQQDLKEKDFVVKLAKAEAEITQMQANAVKLVAQAGKDHQSSQIEDHRLKLDTIKTQLDNIHQAHQQMIDSTVANKELQLKAQEQQNQHQQALTGHAVQFSADQNNANIAQQQVDQAGQQQGQQDQAPEQDTGSSNDSNQ